MSETNGRIEILRAVGYDQAADLLERLDAIDAARATADEVEQPQKTERQDSPAEVQRQREGEAMMAALRESIPGIYNDR